MTAGKYSALEEDEVVALLRLVEDLGLTPESPGKLGRIPPRELLGVLGIVFFLVKGFFKTVDSFSSRSMTQNGGLIKALHWMSP